MTDLTIEQYMLRFFQITAKYDDTDFWWRTDGEYAPVTIIVNCNDFFGPGSDAECLPKTKEALDAFEQAYADCKVAGLSYYGSLLWAARHRNEHPWPHKVPESLRFLFAGSVS